MTRAHAERLQEWNSCPRMAVEHNEKFLLNQMADDGHSLNVPHQNPDFDSVYEDTLGDTTEARASVIRKQAESAHMPSNTHIFVLPKNHSARGKSPFATCTACVGCTDDA